MKQVELVGARIEVSFLLRGHEFETHFYRKKIYDTLTDQLKQNNVMLSLCLCVSDKSITSKIVCFQQRNESDERKERFLIRFGTNTNKETYLRLKL